MRITRKGLEAAGVEAEAARRIVGLLDGSIDYREHPAVVKWTEQCYHDPRERSSARAECLMVAIDAEMRTHGVEAIEGRYVDRYHGTIQATYCNAGETYAATVLYDCETGRFILTSWGDWVERNERRRRIV